MFQCFKEHDMINQLPLEKDITLRITFDSNDTLNSAFIGDATFNIILKT